ncbi:MAG: nucleoside triphosphate pyrophosphohydrolase [Acidimicrobiaceae bacterium]|nr:nucleoside triphosphate pyrophosphohydrolase [Acidimicrobiaceae bacterium]
MKGSRVVVIGLGPGDPGLLTSAAVDAVARIPHRWVRTRRHPTAPVVEPAASFDEIYETATEFDEVYPAIVDRLVAAANEHGEILYAVPGSPLVAERTVELLRAAPVDVEILPSVSFLDLAWDRLEVDPLAAGARLVDGHRFGIEAAGQTGPLLVAQCDSQRVLSDIKLAVDDGPEVTVLQRLGLPDEEVRRVAWADLDRAVTPDHLTSVWLPALAEPVAAELARFDALVRTLREQCPWDRKQTHRSLTRHLLEETYEVLEAIDELDRDPAAGYAHLEEELGDLLFQVEFHATLAAEQGQFAMADVARGIHDKLVRRHPHVFGGQPASWEEIKRAEKGRASVMDGVAGNLPSLLYAHKVQAKASSLGFDWESSAGPWDKLHEEIGELRVALDHSGGGPEVDAELGDILFTVVNLARHVGVDPESALRDAAGKFRRRVMSVERLAAARGLELRDLDLAALDRLWEEAKRLARSPLD